ncbi:MAG: cupin domain-containing protein [Bryobacteraceae bacterium]
MLLTQEQPKAGANKLPVLHSKAYRAEDLQTKPDHGIQRTGVFDGITTRGERIGLHLSELDPGAEPSPAHVHRNEEIVVIREGTLQVTINGDSTNMGPGSVAYVQAGDSYGLKLVGTTPAKYIVIALGDR